MDTKEDILETLTRDDLIKILATIHDFCYDYHSDRVIDEVGKSCVSYVEKEEGFSWNLWEIGKKINIT